MPYAIYGHSMGTLLGYLVTQRIVQSGKNPPLHLFMTGCRAPSANRDEKRHLLPKDQFIAKLREYGGTLDDILNDADLMNFFEPVLRADFECIENYVHSSATPLDIPITVIIGSEEPTTPSDAQLWQKETTQPLAFHQFPGKHFFIFNHQESIIRLIVRDLQKKLVYT
jgi:surfactin synthase thioesterase subunit